MKGVLSVANLMQTIQNILLFKEPEKKEDFILKENDYERKHKNESHDREKIEEGKREEKEKKESPKADVPLIKKIFKKNSEEKEKEKEESDKTEKKNVSRKLSENMEYMKMVYSIPTNGDIIIREFDIIVQDKVIPAFMIFIDGMVDRKVINDDVLQPLMILSNLKIKSDEKEIVTYIRNHLLPHNQIKETNEYQKVLDEVNFGGFGLFVDGTDTAFTGDVKGWEHRGVERPNTEIVIRGPQEGFNEILRVNTALIRKRLKDEDLIVENIEVGARSKTPCAMMYIKDLANESLVNEARRRIKSINIDYLHDSGELEQLIEDNSIMPEPQIIATERPDRVAALLTEGRVGILVHGSPFALIVPIISSDLIHSSEDAYLRYPYANLLRTARIIAIFMSLLLPGIYIAITNYHQEMIPTDLLLAIEASREKVPFPSVVEILMMEVAFELIREAGIRIPGPIGPTLGIIGALILGQAAVGANIVSPIMIIIVAVTGIGSFSIPSFSLAFSFRIFRFVYIILGAAAGLLGVTTGMFVHTIILVRAKSFGVPFMSPFAPKTKGGLGFAVGRELIWKQEKRPDYLNPKDDTRQPKVSRGWTKKRRRDGEDAGK